MATANAPASVRKVRAITAELDHPQPTVLTRETLLLIVGAVLGVVFWIIGFLNYAGIANVEIRPARGRRQPGDRLPRDRTARDDGAVRLRDDREASAHRQDRGTAPRLPAGRRRGGPVRHDPPGRDRRGEHGPLRAPERRDPQDGEPARVGRPRRDGAAPVRRAGAHAARPAGRLDRHPGQRGRRERRGRADDGGARHARESAPAAGPPDLDAHVRDGHLHRVLRVPRHDLHHGGGVPAADDRGGRGGRELLASRARAP